MMLPLPTNLPIEAIPIVVDALRGFVPNKTDAVTALWNVAGYAAAMALKVPAPPAEVHAATNLNSADVAERLGKVHAAHLPGHAAAGQLGGLLKGLPWEVIAKTLSDLVVKILLSSAGV